MEVRTMAKRSQPAKDVVAQNESARPVSDNNPAQEKEDPKNAINIRLPNSLIKALKMRSVEEDCRTSSLVERIISDYLNQTDPNSRVHQILRG
jgi:hypothetical protein